MSDRIVFIRHKDVFWVVPIGELLDIILFSTSEAESDCIQFTFTIQARDFGITFKNESDTKAAFDGIIRTVSNVNLNYFRVDDGGKEIECRAFEKPKYEPSEPKMDTYAFVCTNCKNLIRMTWSNYEPGARFFTMCPTCGKRDEVIL